MEFHNKIYNLFFFSKFQKRPLQKDSDDRWVLYIIAQNKEKQTMRLLHIIAQNNTLGEANYDTGNESIFLLMRVRQICNTE